MKSNKVLNILFSLIIIGLIATVFYISFSKNNVANEQVPFNNSEQHELFQVFSQEKLLLNGIISANITEDVQMKVSGKIDNNNRSLKEGTGFKKNEILIKVERLEALYEILTTRSEFKELIQKLILSIRDQTPNETDKWTDYENKIQRTLPLPTLPNTSSKNEEDLLNRLNVYSQYYKTKVSERKAEEYIYVAPFDGTIIESNVHPGSSIQSGKTILILAKSNTYQVVSHIQLKDLNRITNNDTVEFSSMNGEVLSKGLFTKTGQTLSDSSTIEILYSIFSQNKKYLNTPIKFSIGKEGATIPNSAIKNNSVEIVVAEKVYNLKIKPIKVIGDCTIVEGLPQHSFINIGH